MTCKDCIHSGLCYKENDYENFPDRCGNFISDKVLEEKSKGEWIFDKENSFTIDMFKCSICGCFGDTHFKFCPDCGADMRKGGKEE